MVDLYLLSTSLGLQVGGLRREEEENAIIDIHPSLGFARSGPSQQPGTLVVTAGYRSYTLIARCLLILSAVMAKSSV